MKKTLFAALLLATLAAPAARAADDVATFYKGKTIQLIIGYSVGGGYDTYARVLARYLGNHIPGNPSVIPQNMPGAGSLKAINYLYNVAPKDGTFIGTFGRGVPMEPLFQGTGTQFDATKLTWLGSVTNEVSVCAFRKDSGINSWQDMRDKPFTLGGTGSGSDTDIFPNVLRNMFDLPLKLVTGFPGGTDVVLAMERGEINGRCGWSWSSLESRNKTMLDSGAIHLVLQLALQKHEDLPQVPLIMDLARNDQEKAALKLIFSRQSMARPFAAPPGIPEDRKRALREAFDATMKDPQFLAEAQKQDLEVRPVTGDEVEALVTEIYAATPDVIALAKTAVQDAK
jgi:tripartite-type tricarboxylate transporter receptor subunit TctC